MIFKQRETRNVRTAAGRLAWFVVAALSLCEVACGPADEILLWADGGRSRYRITHEDMSPLVHAAAMGDVVTVRKLLKQDGDVDMREDIQLALRLATMAGRPDVVPLLLAHGADPNDQEQLSEAEAAQARDSMELRYRRAPVNNFNRFDATPLHLAISAGQARIAELLMNAKGTDPNIPNAMGATALHQAAWLGDEDMVTKLLAKGAATDVKDRWGSTPLHYGVGRLGYGFRKGRARMGIVRALIDAKSPLNVKNDEGYTPVHKAIRNDCKRMAWLLVRSGAEVDIFSAAGLGMTLRVKRMVRENKKLASAMDPNGYIPLNWACYSDSVPLVKFLLSQTPQAHELIDYYPHAPGTSLDNFTPLEIAVGIGNEEVVKFLLDQGATPSPMGSSRPLYFAIAKAPNPEVMVKLLIKRGADPNEPRHRPPLHEAAKRGMKDVVKILVDAGADLNAKDDGEEGKTALDHAIERKHKSVVTILKRAAAAQKKIEEWKKRRPVPITHTIIVPARRVKVR